MSETNPKSTLGPPPGAKDVYQAPTVRKDADAEVQALIEASRKQDQVAVYGMNSGPRPAPKVSLTAETLPPPLAPETLPPPGEAAGTAAADEEPVRDSSVPVPSSRRATSTARASFPPEESTYRFVQPRTSKKPTPR